MWDENDVNGAREKESALCASDRQVPKTSSAMDWRQTLLDKQENVWKLKQGTTSNTSDFQSKKQKNSEQPGNIFGQTRSSL